MRPTPTRFAAAPTSLMPGIPICSKTRRRPNGRTITDKCRCSASSRRCDAPTTCSGSMLFAPLRDSDAIFQLIPQMLRGGTAVVTQAFWHFHCTRVRLRRQHGHLLAAHDPLLSSSLRPNFFRRHALFCRHAPCRPCITPPRRVSLPRSPLSRSPGSPGSHRCIPPPVAPLAFAAPHTRSLLVTSLTLPKHRCTNPVPFPLGDESP
jgi:hypothetical protein